MANVTVIDKEGEEHEMSIANSFDMVNHLNWTVKGIDAPTEEELAAEKEKIAEAAASAVAKAKEDEEAALAQTALADAADKKALEDAATKDAADKKALEDEAAADEAAAATKAEEAAAAAADKNSGSGRRRGNRNT